MEKEGRKEEIASMEEAVTDIFINSEKSNVLGSACTLHYLVQETHRPAYELLRSLQPDICSSSQSKPLSTLGLTSVSPPHLVQILPLYTRIYQLGY